MGVDSVARLGSARLGSARLGSARLGSARLGSARLGSLFALSAVTVLAALPAACSQSEGEHVGQTSAARQEALSYFAMERIIPLRIVMMARDCGDNFCGNGPCETGENETNCAADCRQPYNCGPPPPANECTSCSNGEWGCGADTADYAEIRDSVEKANWALKALGVQIYVRSIEKYKMPLFWKFEESAEELPWSTTALREQLDRPYPALWDGTFPMTDDAQRHFWTHAVATRVGDPREIVVWVAECSSGWDGARPWIGPSSMTADRHLFRSPRALAHEIGHILGLEHTMSPAASKNPEKQSDWDWGDNWDYWDLVYSVNGSGQNVYFSNRTQAFAGGTLYPKHSWAPANCWAAPPNCTMTCEIPLGSGKWETIGTPGIAGLGFTFAGDNPAAGLYRRGPNAMAYMTELPEVCDWTTFSESQAEQVKRLLRADIRINDTNILAPYAANYRALRPLLGDLRARWGFDQIDVEFDGKRDIAVWNPPGTWSLTPVCGDGICQNEETPGSCSQDCPASCGDGSCDAADGACPKDCGRFQVLKSSSGYVTLLERDFGRTGDVPVPADYDGDNHTDFAVVRTGGLTTNPPNMWDSQLWWLWCRSSWGDACTINPNCATVSDGCFAWGQREDVPLPGLELDGNTSTREVAVYRPSTRQIYWRVLGSATNGTIDLSRMSNDVVHMHGLYDADNKTDAVVYEPANSRFYMLLSAYNWNPTQSITRNFSTVLRADALGASGAGSQAAAVRHGGVALPALKNGRRALRVWDAYLGHWYTMWDPVTSSAVQSCQWGAARDIPIAGPIDRDNNGLTDLVVYRPTHTVGSVTTPMMLIKSPPTTTDCGANIHQFTMAGTPRSQIWAVNDMGGDGRGDFLVQDPDQLTWTRWYSTQGGGFMAQPTLALGWVGAMGL